MAKKDNAGLGFIKAGATKRAKNKAKQSAGRTSRSGNGKRTK